jgi:hypothetical protein
MKMKSNIFTILQFSDIKYLKHKFIDINSGFSSKNVVRNAVLV